MRVGSLFAGIGGFDLGLERAGFQTAWFCEQDEFCQQVLTKHWPGVPIYDDICQLKGQDVEPVDILCGGFPCQDLSVAGRGAGIEGERSGLWSEYARLVGELRPRYVFVENVPALLTRGLGRVVGDLAALGYDAEWDCIPASAVGASHRRDRIWLVAYPSGKPGGVEEHRSSGQERKPADSRQSALVRQENRASSAEGPASRHRTGNVADPESYAERPGLCQGEQAEVGGRRLGYIGGKENPWAVEPDVGRVADGVPARVDRLRALGNALVPQIAEWIGHRVQEWEAGAR